MGTYHGKKLVVRRDGTGIVVYDGAEIGRVFPDPADRRAQARDWKYQHVSAVTLKDLHPHWTWPRTSQTAMGQQPAARDLADMHEKILVTPTKPGISFLLAEEGLARATKSGVSRDGSPRPGFVVTVLRPGAVAVRYSADENRAEMTSRYAEIITGAGYSVEAGGGGDLIVSSGTAAGQ